MDIGPEAGHNRPPLRPRIKPTSSTTAPFSREQFSLQVPFSQVLAAAHQELTETGTVMPSQKRLSRRSLRVFGLASENSIKTANFEEQFPYMRLRRMVGNEKHTGSTHEDAQSKAVTAAENEIQYRKDHPWKVRFIDGQWRKATVTSGLDVVNFLPTITAEGKVAFERVGKPQRVNAEDPMGSIQRRFAQLSEMARENNWPYVPYGIEMTTYIHNPKKPKDSINNSSQKQRPSYDAESKRKAIIMLDPAVIAYIATDEGFKKYQEVQVSESHLTLPQVAAGMQIEKLREMGAIRYIANNVEELSDPTPSQDRYRRAKHLALSSFDRSLLAEYRTKFPPRLSERLRIKNTD